MTLRFTEPVTSLKRLLVFFAATILGIGAAQAQNTYYSAKTDSTTTGGGAWSNPNSWSTDPGGQLFPGFGIPTRGPGQKTASTGTTTDRVVILSGVTIIMDVNNVLLNGSTGLVEIRAGGRLELRNTTGHNFQTFEGEGTIAFFASAGNVFTLPTVTTNNFILPGGGTHEFGGTVNDGNIPSPTVGTGADYNNVAITGSRLHRLNVGGANNLVLNGNLSISGTAGFRFDNNDAVVRTMTVAGNISVTSTAATAFGVELVGSNKNHILNVGGNFTTSGSIVFTDRTIAGGNGASAQHVNLVFNNTLADQLFTTTGATTSVRLHDIGIAKGTDATYILDVTNVDASPNWGLIGPNNGTHTGDLQDTPDATVVDLNGGSIRFGSSCNFELKTGNNYNIPSNSQFINNGANIAVNGTSAIVLYGKFRNQAGNTTLGNNNDRGFTYRETGDFEINNGIVAAQQIGVSTVAGTHRGSFVMTGGELNLLVGNPAANGSPKFQLPFQTMSARISGGVINVSNISLPGADVGLDIRIAEGNYVVTGGTLNILINEADDFRINSSIPFANVTIGGTSTGTVFCGVFGAVGGGVPAAGETEVLNPFRVLFDLTVGVDGSTVSTFDLNAAPLQVGRDLNVNNNDILDVTGSSLVFNGSQNGTFTYDRNPADGTPAVILNKLVVDKDLATRGVTLAMGTGATNLDVHFRTTDSLSVNAGILEYSTFRISARGAILNDGRIGLSASTGRLLVDNTTAQTIVVSGTSAVSRIGHLEVNNTAGLTLSGGSIDTLGTLTLTAGLFSIGTNGILLQNAIAGGPFSATRMVQTSGNASDGGIGYIYSGTGATARTFNFGVGAKYTPATATVDLGAGNTGALTLRPANKLLATLNNVAGAPTAGNDNQALTYYWRASSTGFTGTPNVNYSFTATTADQPGGATTADWTVGYVLDQNPFTRTDLVAGVGGGYNAGTFTLTVPAHALVNANYTAGYDDDAAAATPGKFVGAPQKWYSRSTGYTDWFGGTTWSNSDVEPTIDPSQYYNVVGGPAENPTTWTNAGGQPGPGDIVYIGFTFDNPAGAAGLRYEAHNVFYQQDGGTLEFAELIYVPIPELDQDGAPEWADRAYFQIRNGNRTATPYPTLLVDKVRGSGGTFGIGTVGNAANQTTNVGSVDFGDFNAASDNEFFIQAFNEIGGEGTGGTREADAVNFPSQTPDITRYPSVFPSLRLETGAYNGAQIVFSKDITVNFNMNLEGGAVVTLNNTASGGNINVGGNLVLRSPSSGTYADAYEESQVRFQPTGTARTVTVAGNVIFELSNPNAVTPGGIDIGRIFVDSTNVTSGTEVTTHRLRVGGNISQNSPRATGLRLYSTTAVVGQARGAVQLEFFGSNNSIVSKAGTANNATIPQLSRIIVNKDAAANTVTVNTNFVLNPLSPAATKAITLTQGILTLNPPAAQSIVLSTGGVDFDINQNSALILQNNVTATITNALTEASASGISLDGVLRVLGNSSLSLAGDATGTTTATTSVSSIVYGSTGTAVLQVGADGASTAALNVDGQIRRSALTDAGVLAYSQNGSGNVTIATRVDADATNNPTGQTNVRGVFEVAGDAGNSFSMAGTGNLVIAGARNGTFPEAYIVTTTTSVTGGTIVLGDANIPAAEVINIQTDNSTALSSLTVFAPAAFVNTGQVNVADLTLTGNLLIAGTNTAVFIDGNRNIKVGGNFTLTSPGRYQPSGTSSTLTFNGTGPQTFAWGTASAANNRLVNVVVNKSAGTLNWGGAQLAQVDGDITVSQGVLNLNNNVNLFGDLTVNSGGSTTGAGYVDFRAASAGASPQTIGGGGSINNIRLTGVNATTAYAIESASEVLVVGDIDFTAATATRNINLLSNRLDVTETTSYTNSSSTRFLRDSGNLTGTSGISLAVDLGAFTETIPVGVTTRFTPVSYSGTATTAGSILIRPIGQTASFHTDITDVPVTVGADSALGFHWIVASQNGLVLSALTHTYTYDESDVNPGPGNDVDYRAGNFLNNASSWNTDVAFLVNAATNTLTFNNFLDINATYSAGAIGEMGAINTFYSRNIAPVNTVGGDFFTANNWSTDDILQHTGVAASLPPDPSVNPTGGAGRAIVDNNHIIQLTTTNTELFSLQIDGPNGEFQLLAGTFGNNLRSISGGGVLQLQSAALPSADYTGFIDSTSGGTFRFAGTSNYTIPGTSDIPYYRNVQITGSGTRTVPAGGLNINGNLTVNNATLDLNGQTMYVKGNLRVTGTGSLTGTGTIILDGNTTQILEGVTIASGNTLRILKTGGGITLASNTTINGSLVWASNAVIAPAGFTITFGSGGTVTGANDSRYVNGSVTKITSGADAFIFPIGNSSAGNYLPIEISNAGSNTYRATFVNSATTTPISSSTSGNVNYLNDAMVEINPGSYFEIFASAAGSAEIRMFWENEIAPFSTPITDIVVASTDNPNSGASVWISEGGDNHTGNVTTIGSVSAGRVSTFASPRYFTTGSISQPLPVELLSFTGVRTGTQSNLKWVTASELNNDRFEIERSLDGINYSVVGFVLGNGTTQDLTQYSFTDFDVPGIDVVYYRLHQFDYDGKSAYTYAIAIRQESGSGAAGNQWMLQPNPTTAAEFGLVVIGYELDVLTDRHIVEVRDFNGRVLYTGTGLLNELNTGIRNALQFSPTGTYVVNVTSKGYQQSLLVVVK